MRDFFTDALLIAAVLFEYYVIYAFIRSKMGKYPPYVSTRKGMVKLLAKETEFILADESTPKNVVEPGCGNARITICLAKKYPNHSFVGYEWDWVPYLLAKIKSCRLKNVKILRQNFMTADYTKTDLAILFTGNEIAQELGEKLKNDMPAGAYVVSESFEMKQLPLVKTLETGKANWFFLPQKVYFYKIEK